MDCLHQPPLLSSYIAEIARSQISAANYVATTSHALILDAQANIVRSEKDIPVTKKELVGHNRNNWLKAGMGDIKVITMILKSTDCDAKEIPSAGEFR